MTVFHCRFRWSPCPVVAGHRGRRGGLARCARRWCSACPLGVRRVRGLPETGLPRHLIDSRRRPLLRCSLSSACSCCATWCPAPTVDTRPGNRRVNWVWYVNVDELALAGLLTGHRRGGTTISCSPGTDRGHHLLACRAGGHCSCRRSSPNWSDTPRSSCSRCTTCREGRRCSPWGASFLSVMPRALCDRTRPPGHRRHSVTRPRWRPRSARSAANGQTPRGGGTRRWAHQAELRPITVWLLARQSHLGDTGPDSGR